MWKYCTIMCYGTSWDDPIGWVGCVFFVCNMLTFMCWKYFFLQEKYYICILYHLMLKRVLTDNKDLLILQWSMPWLLMPCWCKELRLQQPWYWHNFSRDMAVISKAWNLFFINPMVLEKSCNYISCNSSFKTLEMPNMETVTVCYARCENVLFFDCWHIYCTSWKSILVTYRMHYMNVVFSCHIL